MLFVRTILVTNLSGTKDIVNSEVNKLGSLEIWKPQPSKAFERSLNSCSPSRCWILVPMKMREPWNTYCSIEMLYTNALPLFLVDTGLAW